MILKLYLLAVRRAKLVKMENARISVVRITSKLVHFVIVSIHQKLRKYQTQQNKNLFLTLFYVVMKAKLINKENVKINAMPVFKEMMKPFV